MTREEIREAVARGWCAPGQGHKTFDADLAEAIADEVYKALVAERVVNNVVMTGCLCHHKPCIHDVPKRSG